MAGGGKEVELPAPESFPISSRRTKASLDNPEVVVTAAGEEDTIELRADSKLE